MCACRVAGRTSVTVNALHSTDPKKRVVITGMSVCSVFGNDVDVYYDKLLSGTSGANLSIASIDSLQSFPSC